MFLVKLLPSQIRRPAEKFTVVVEHTLCKCNDVWGGRSKCHLSKLKQVSQYVSAQRVLHVSELPDSFWIGLDCCN